MGDFIMHFSLLTGRAWITPGTLDRYISYLVGRCGSIAMGGHQYGLFHYLQEIRAMSIW